MVKSKNNDKYEKKLYFLGKIALLVTLLASLFFVISIFSLANKNELGGLAPYVITTTYPLIYLGVILGAINYFGPIENKKNLFGLLINLLLLFVGPILLSLI